MDVSITTLSSFLGNVTLIIILLVLFIRTIIDIISYSGLSDWPKLSWLYSGKDRALDNRIRKVISQLGINTERIRVLSPSINNGEAEFSTEDAFQQLIILLVKYTEFYRESIIYGDNTPHRSYYYINTLEASAFVEYNNKMRAIVCDLINRNYKEHSPPDFIIASKLGNVELAQAVARFFKIPCIICKSSHDPSKIKTTSQVPESNFEGFSRIQDLIKNYPDRKLNGITIDCNCSGGGSIIKVTKDFNSLVESKYHSNISQIEATYVLFRADTESSSTDIDSKFKNSGLTLYRYIDLDEELKKILYSNKDLFAQKKYEISNGRVKKKVSEIQTYAKKNKILIMNKDYHIGN